MWSMMRSRKDRDTIIKQRYDIEDMLSHIERIKQEIYRIQLQQTTADSAPGPGQGGVDVADLDEGDSSTSSYEGDSSLKVALRGECRSMPFLMKSH